MNALDKLAANLTSILLNIDNIIEREARKESEFIGDLNRKQLINGVKGDGSDMPQYVQGSKQPSAQGKITLFDTGDFHRGITPLFNDDGFDMDSSDWKTNILKTRYGDILDLTDKSKTALRLKLRPSITKEILKQVKK